ncbi:MAG: ABC transporter ATP-binding protein [Verrucomicrobia bacterium]|nr:ABC transporter ATP-binding protein [Verrucomicrobiota bacterium]
MPPEYKGAGPVLEVRDLSVTYGKGARAVQALDGISLDLRPGEIFGLIGPNGAGKTTLIKAVLGLLTPERGEVRVGGEPGGSVSAKAMLGFMPELAYYYEFLRVGEFLRLCGRLCGLGRRELERRIDTLVERVGLGAHRRKLIKHYSKGMRQKLGLAQAILHEPQVLLLDEPTSGLDPLARRDVRRLMLELRAEGRALLFSSHELSEVETVCDRVAMINGGRLIVAGSLDEILKPYRSYRARVRTAQIERLRQACASSAATLVEGGALEDEVESYVVVARTIEALPALLQRVVDAGALIEDVDHGYESLERLYAEIVEGK